MICKVKNTIEKYKMLDNVRSVAVGVSGGADSMCLIHILSLLKEQYGIILKVVHLNHNLRGEEALRDELRVREYCKKNNIQCLVFSEDIHRLAAEKGISEEECGRLVRYECFSEAQCDAVAVAHSFSDSVETFIFNLLRGTGSKGLCGIPAKRPPNIIRPLIECTRQEIEKYCIDNSLDFVTDSTNLSDDYTRNFIRHNIIPSFLHVNSAYEKSLFTLMNIMSEENGFIEQSVAELLKQTETEKGYDAERFKAAHPAVRKRAVAEILKKSMNKSVSAKHIELVDKTLFLQKGKTQIAEGLYICVNGGIMSICREKKSEEVRKSVFINGEAENSLGKFIIEEISCDRVNESYLNCFDGDKIKGELVLSVRMPSDKFTLKKRKVTKSIKKLFNELGIPPEQRDYIPVVRDDENVVWIEGVGVNAPYIPDKGTKKYCAIKKEG